MAKRSSKKNKVAIGPLVVIGLLIVIAVYWLSRPTVADRTADIQKCLMPSLRAFNVSEDDLVRRSSEERGAGAKKYTHTTEQYSAPKAFGTKKFESDLKARLVKAGFRIASSDRVFGRDTELLVYEINRGSLGLFTLKLNKPRVPALAEVSAVLPPPKPAPEAAKKSAKPKVAIVIDDFGYNMTSVNMLFAIQQPVTLSVLPHVKYSKEVARLARSKGYEVILHLPLESSRSDVQEEANTITTKMSDKEITSKLASDIQSVPGITGVSNHMGSKATEDKRVMTVIISYLKTKRLYFFDSFTAQKSVCRDVARSLSVPTAKRDIFLDNSSDMAEIEAQMAVVKKMAFKYGQAIAICHDRANSIKALARKMPEMSGEGIEFVRLSELVK
jgi:polysaccharide deacetylase 2 family uncharacterized protein YibQ